MWPQTLTGLAVCCCTIKEGRSQGLSEGVERSMRHSLNSEGGYTMATADSRLVAKCMI